MTAGPPKRTVGVMSALRGQRGQASTEYVGVVIAAALLVLVIVASDLGPKLAGGIENAVCQVLGEECGSEEESGSEEVGSPVDPELTDDERVALLAEDPQDAQGVLESLSPEELEWLRQNDPGAYEAATRAQTWADERSTVDDFATGDLDDFLDYKDSEEQDPDLDYSDDGCSNSPDSTFLYDFTEACERHDFGYRNYKRLGLFDEEKGNVDDQFLEDMRDHCATRSVFKQPGCYAAAEAYHQAVSELGGENCGPLFPGRLPGSCASENG